jgi:hypothetical protein
VDRRIKELFWIKGNQRKMTNASCLSLFLTALETEKSNIKVPASGKGLPAGL